MNFERRILEEWRDFERHQDFQIREKVAKMKVRNILKYELRDKAPQGVIRVALINANVFWNSFNSGRILQSSRNLHIIAQCKKDIKVSFYNIGMHLRVFEASPFLNFFKIKHHKNNDTSALKPSLNFSIL